MVEPALYARMELRIKEFEKQLAKVQRSTDKGMSNIERRTKSMTTQVSALGRNAFAGFATGAAAVLAPILSVGAALNGAKSALAEFDKIGKAAKAGGLDAEAYQAYAYAAELGGVETEQFAKALETFAKSSGLAVVGKGKMVAALKALNPELLANIQAATSQDERLRLVADALDKESDASRKAAIAAATFGDAGIRMVEMLKGGSAALDDTARKARQLGIIVDRQLIASAETLNDEFSTATKVMDLQFKQALVNLAPILVGIAKRAANLAGDIRRVIDSMKDLENRSSLTLSGNATDNDRARLELENQILELREKQRQVTGFTAEAERRLIGGQIAALEERLVALTEKGAKIETILGSRKPDEPALPPGAGIPEVLPTTRNAKAEAAIREAEAVKELIASLQEELALVGASEEQLRAAAILRQAGAAATDEQRAALVMLNEELYRAQEAERQAGEAAKFLQDGLFNAFKDMIPAIETGNAALDSFLNTLLETIARAALLGQGPLAGLFGGGGLASLFGGGFPAAPTTGVGLYHSGGVAGRPSSTRNVSPGIFAGAPRYHNGGVAGLRPDEVPAILQRGEVITPRGAGGARPMPVDVRVSVDQDGNLQAYVQGESRRQATGIVAKAAPSIVNASKGATFKEIGRGGADSLLGARFGVRPQVSRKT